MSAVSERETSRGVWRVSSLASSLGRVNLLSFVLSLAICSTIAISKPSRIQPRYLQKRSFNQFCILLTQFTDRACTEYTGHGCFCGRVNYGNAPLDDVDRCCQAHDRCYDDTQCSINPLLVNYDAGCGGKSCWCLGNSCNFEVCMCDVTFAKCLDKTSHPQWKKRNCPWRSFSSLVG